MRLQLLQAATVGALALGAVACVGTVEPHGTRVSSRGGEPPGVTAGLRRFACEPGMYEAGTTWRRLTRQQYENTLTDLLVWSLGEREEAQVRLDAVRPLLQRLPVEERYRSPEDLHGSYRRLDQVMSQSHVEAYYQIARHVADELTNTPERLQGLVGACATDAVGDNDAECLDAFVQRFGAQAMRRPLQTDEVAFYRGFYGDSPGEDAAGYADVIAGLLVSPQFLYIIEHGDDVAGEAPNSYALTPFELAARLSYHFWDSMPDNALWEAASSGALLDPEGYVEAVERVFEDPRTQRSLREFYRDWLKLEDLPALHMHNASPLFQAFAGSDLPSEALRQHVIDEALDMVDHFTWHDPAGFDGLFTSDLAFPRTPDLAQIYGLDTWDGVDEPPAFARGERPGLLTRVAFLATGTPNTRPIMKGVFIRENILCDKIPPPPDNAGASPPELSETSSTREVVEALTQQEGTPCAGCHTGMINPLGFATEGFDALGRMRRAQALFAEDGTPRGTVSVDTSSVPQVVLGDQTPSDGPEDLMYLIAHSGKAHACFVRHYFRFSFGRFEQLATDGCLLERMRESLMETGSISDMLKEVALSPEFRRRRFVQ